MTDWVILNNVRYEIKELDHIKNQLEKIEASLTRCTQELSLAPKSHTLSDTREILLDRKSKHLERMKVIYEHIAQAEEIVSFCDDAMIRLRMERRFFEGKSWGQIAMKEGGMNTGNGVRMSVVRYLR